MEQGLSSERDPPAHSCHYNDYAAPVPPLSVYTVKSVSTFYTNLICIFTWIYNSLHETCFSLGGKKKVVLQT